MGIQERTTTGYVRPSLHSLTRLLLVWCCLLGPLSATELLKDINTDDHTPSSFPRVLVEFDGMVFFGADDGEHGPGLWKTDGTEDGTTAVRELGRVVELLVVGEDLLVATRDALWKSDGTTTGTVLLAQFANPSRLTAVGSDMYFVSDSGDDTVELWKTDGTDDGTCLVQDGFERIGTLLEFEEQLVFSASIAGSFHPWITDGTIDGTKLLTEYVFEEEEPPSDWHLGGGGYYSGYWYEEFELAVANGLLYILTPKAYGGSCGYAPPRYPPEPPPSYPRYPPPGPYLLGEPTEGVWQTDLTSEGTEVIAESIRGIASVGEILYLSDVYCSGEDESVTQYSLLRWDATDDATVVLADDLSAQVNLRTVVDDETDLYFVSGSELWISDGTEKGTVRLESDISIEPRSLTLVESELYFIAWTEEAGAELWKTSGSVDDAELIRDIEPGYGSALDYFWTFALTSSGDFANASGGFGGGLPGFVALDGELYFSAFTTENEWELWKSDGTEVGTNLVRDIHSGGSHSNPRNFTAAGDDVFFLASSESTVGVWVTDGTAEGTTEVDTLSASPIYNSSSFPLQAFDGSVFYGESNGSGGWELRSASGSEDSATLVKEMSVEEGTSVLRPRELTVAGDLLFFVAGDPEAGVEIWRSDGTDAGTSILKEIQDGEEPRYWWEGPRGLVAFGDKLAFTAFEPDTGYEVWLSDGTEEGTEILADLWSGPSPLGYWERPQWLTAVGEQLFYVANDGDSGWELWVSDGTAANTSLVSNLEEGADPAYYWSYEAPRNLIGIGDSLFFSKGAELWVSDGSGDGTELFAELDTPPYQLTDIDGTLFFSVLSADNLPELWTSDGSEDGTELLRQIDAQNLFGVDGTLYFDASEGDRYELWTSDGTAEGTRPVAPLEPRLVAGTVTVVQQHVYASGYTFEHGLEPWIMFFGDDFLRGDANGDGVFSALPDALYLLRWAFLEEPMPPCQDAADANDDGRVSGLLDAIFILAHGFGDGAAPPDPGTSECGPDATDSDELDCTVSACPD